MRKQRIAQGVIERVDFPNKGIGFVEETGEKMMVKNTLPGQKVRVRITRKRSGMLEGQLLEVTERSGKEQEPDCVHFGQCGGCLYRTLPYQEQLKLKEEQVRSLLEKVCPDPGFEGIKASPVAEGYRNKMEFSFGDAFRNGPLSLGMHKRGSFYDVVTVDGCRIVDGDYRMILSCVLDLCRKWELPYYHRTRHEGYLRHLMVRKAAGTKQILVDLITTSQTEGVFNASRPEEAFTRALTEALLHLDLTGELTGILHTRNDSVADTVLNEGTEILWGKDFFFETLLGLTFRITPFSFFQTNSPGAQLLYGIVREYAGDTKDKTIFDLYSGTGTIAQILSPIARSVTGVEIVPEAVRSARENAVLNGLTNCSFLTGDVLKVVDELEEKPDLIVLDPPRDGIHPKALPKIIGFGVERIIYVSCKPTSLVRDLEVLQSAGYRLQRSCCVDMFPATANIETVCLLTRRIK